MAGHLREALSKLRPEEVGYFRSQTEAYLARIGTLMAEVGKHFHTLGRHKVVTYAPAFPYLLRWLEVEEAECIMTVPGMEPSAKRISEVITRMKAEEIWVILTMPQYSGKVPETIAEETGAKTPES